jgi:hypothetical protein
MNIVPLELFSVRGDVAAAAMQYRVDKNAIAGNGTIYNLQSTSGKQN